MDEATRAKTLKKVQEIKQAIDYAVTRILDDAFVEGLTEAQNMQLYSIAVTATDGDQAWSLYQQYLEEEGYSKGLADSRTT